ncbi:hypothetical protein JJV70_00795 [Streptomyces sp. JJ66]|uniref:hypothetical protein n=1 Tax=Streptomyces sp. JJ66 TaxID=2803843 RepID=UPI001C59EB6D|nr:hypothetical protein [Streptomyces sp. JJ66]MBW1600666.1 hypothetical protein [Streptomyces sp. JJ66]
MDALLHGLSVSITAGGPDRIVGLADTDVCFALTCRPILLGVVTAGRLSQTGSAAVIASRNWNALDLDRISPADASSPASEINALADYCDGPEQRCADHDSP